MSSVSSPSKLRCEATDTGWPGVVFEGWDTHFLCQAWHPLPSLLFASWRTGDWQDLLHEFRCWAHPAKFVLHPNGQAYDWWYLQNLGQKLELHTSEDSRIEPENDSFLVQMLFPDFQGGPRKLSGILSALNLLGGCIVNSIRNHNCNKKNPSNRIHLFQLFGAKQKQR